MKTPRLGLGTWQMGDDSARRADEMAALRTGLDLGLSMIDTAEMYGAGRAETLVGEAIAGRRDEVFLVTKVLPENASRAGVVAACERSLKRLRTDRVDLYLLHWESRHPIAETVAGFESLVKAGKIVRWGVSNFDVGDLDVMSRVDGGRNCAANQVYYNLDHRGAERRVIPWCRSHDVMTQAYTPLDQGRLANSPAVKSVAARHGVAPSAVALAWTMREPGVVAIAKTGRAERVREFVGALSVTLTGDDLRELDAAHAPSSADGPLEAI